MAVTALPTPAGGVAGKRAAQWRVLVLANETADSIELLDELRRIGADHAAHYFVCVPASPVETGVAATQPSATRTPPFTDAAALTMQVPSTPIGTDANPSLRPAGTVIFVSSSPGPAAVM